MELKSVETGILMLCGGKKCCPTIELKSNDTVEIVDDFGGKVNMTIEQATLIRKALEQLSKEQ